MYRVGDQRAKQNPQKQVLFIELLSTYKRSPKKEHPPFQPLLTF
jgi:hypothetical protein